MRHDKTATEVSRPRDISHEPRDAKARLETERDPLPLRALAGDERHESGTAQPRLSCGARSRRCLGCLGALLAYGRHGGKRMVNVEFDAQEHT